VVGTRFKLQHYLSQPINPYAGGLGEALVPHRSVSEGFGGQRPPIQVFPNNDNFSLNSVPFNLKPIFHTP
jgi:hypothetical protein